MKTITIKGTLRNDLGKKSSQTLRNEGLVPCVMYGGDQPIHFCATTISFKQAVYTPDFVKVNIELDGKEYPAIVKDDQFHPLSDKILHVDFLQLVSGKKVTVEVPVKVSGFAKGVQAGGKLEFKTKKVSVKTTADYLIDHINLDITNLEMGKSIKVRELQVEGVEIMTPGNIPVVSISIPRAVRQAAEAAAKK